MGDLREVELEDEEPAEPRPGSRPRRWWILAGALVVAGALVGVQTTMDARRHAHEARFDDVRGVLLPVPDSLRVAWTRPDAQTFAYSSAEVDGRIVHAAVDDGHRSFTISVLDRSSGDVVWSVHAALDPSVVDAIATGAARAEHAVGGGADETDDGTANLGTDAGGASAVCAPMGARYASCALGWLTPWGEAAEPEATQLVVVDVPARTFTSSRAAPLQVGNVVGDTMVVATSAARDGEVVWSLDARAPDGGTRWALTLDPVRVVPTEAGYQAQTSLTVLDGNLMLVDQGHAWVVADGAVVREVDVGTDHYVMPAHGGALQAIPQAAGSDDLQYGRILLTDGQWLTAHGYAVTATVDDGSAPDLLLVDDDERERLVARNARTGWELWSVPAGSVGPATILGGVIYLSVGNTSDATAPSMTLEAIDARTGDVSWAQPLMDSPAQVPQPAEALTDGRAVYARWGSRLKAFALDDGAPLAGRDLPPGTGRSDTFVASSLGLLTSIDYSTDASSAGLDVLG